MTRKRNILALAVFALVLATALTACRGRRHHNHGEMDLQTMERRALEKVGWVLDDIDADDRQREAITSLVKTTVPDVYKLRELHKPVRETMARELLSGKPNAKLLHATVDNAASPLIAFAHKAADRAIAAHSVLNAEQREELAEEWEDRTEDSDDALEDGEWMIEAGLERGLSRMDANEAQYKLVFSLKDTMLAEAKQNLMPTRKQGRSILLAELRSPNPDATKIHATIDASAKVYQAFAHKAVDALVELSRTLTPDQKTMLQEKMNDWKERRGK